MVYLHTCFRIYFTYKYSEEHRFGNGIDFPRTYVRTKVGTYIRTILKQKKIVITISHVRTYTIPYRRSEKNQKSDKTEIYVLTGVYIRT